MNKKGFTIIELIVVIAILGILILLATSKFLGYSEKAQFARIKHDVKVMQTEMQSVMITDPLEVQNYKDNAKDLRELIVKKQLFEKEGLAKTLEKSKPMNKFAMNNIDSDNLDPKIGMGGELYQIESHENYKIIPEEKKKQIRTHLDGAFYVNDSGKVYYEPEKPIYFSNDVIGETDKDLEKQSCNAPEPVDYDFDHLTGTIVKYLGKEQYLTIPSQFKVDEKCWTVKIIGKGAFSKMVPPIKNVVIPPTVEIIEKDAFEGNEIEDLVIPPSVEIIKDNAFGDNPIETVVIQKPEKDIQIGENAFPPNVIPEFSAPKPEDVGLEAKLSPSGDAIITGPSKPNGTNPGENESNPENGPSIPDGILVIPPKVIIDGKEVPVVEIQEGAFQGEGLIEVHLPDTLERIEAYAFAGNQLIGIKIPNSVMFIGTYAFAYNELTNEKGETKPTISYINFKGNEQIHLVNTKTGDIESNGVKINPLYGSEMLDAIWIDSRSEADPEPTYPIIHPNGDKEYEDGRIETPDGSIKYPNGDVRNKDGILLHPDGSVTLNDGTFVPVATDNEFVKYTQGHYAYRGTKKSLVLPRSIKGEEITDATQMFYGKDIERVVLLENSITNMHQMFQESKATTLDLSNFNTSNVTNMNMMFLRSQTTTLDLSNFDTSNVTTMYAMFKESKATKLDLSSFNRSNVTNMKYMFKESQATSLDLSNFDTSNVTDMQGMFESSKATSLDLSSFNTSKVTNMSNMFLASQATTLDLSSFDTSKVTNMYMMFKSVQATTLDLSSFDTSKVTNMGHMFATSNATTVYAGIQADADKFKSSSNKPSGLKFIVE